MQKLVFAIYESLNFQFMRDSAIYENEVFNSFKNSSIALIIKRKTRLMKSRVFKIIFSL